MQVLQRKKFTRLPVRPSKIFGLLSVLLTTTLFLIAVQNENSELATVLLVSLVGLNVASCWSAPKKNAAFLAFNFTFFVFLVSRDLMGLLAPALEASVPKLIVAPGTELEASFLLYVSLVIIRVVYSLRNSLKLPDLKTFFKPSYLTAVRRYSQGLIWLVLGPYMVILLERIAFVNANGYEAYYLTFQSQIPLVFARFGSLYEPLLFLYLGTFPDRKGTRLHLLIYVILGALSLGWGQRNGFVISLMFAIFYLTLRDFVSTSQRKWLSGKMIGFGVLSALPLLAFLAAFTFVRSGNEAISLSFSEWVGRFFVTQGSSNGLLAYTLENVELFPLNKYYSLNPIIAFFKENIISQFLFDVPQYESATRELALNASYFSFAFAYIVNPNYYFSGGGFGSNYVAELWIDFGLPGVIFGSLLYGYLLSSFTRSLPNQGPFWVAFAFAGFCQIIYAPRAEFLGFLTPLLSVPTLGVYMVIHLLAREAERRDDLASKSGCR